MAIRDSRLWFGPGAGVLLLAGTIAIGLVTPGYSHVRQTVSELGEVGAPGQGAFTILLLAVASCLLAFAFAVARVLRDAGSSRLPAWFVGAMGASTAGVGLFAFPHALHNVFGMSELVGYQAPLVAALACWSNPRAKRVVVFSIVMYIAVLLAIAINLVPVIRPTDAWLQVKPYFGLVQRSLFASWFAWCAGYGLLLMRLVRAG